MIRSLEAADKTYVPEHAIIQTQIQDMLETYGIKRILLCVRVSPNTTLSATDDVNQSLIRQQEFLNLMVGPELSQTTSILKAKKVSATCDDFLTMLSDQLAAMKEPTLVLSTMTDRVTRSIEHLPRIKEMTKEGHIFASLIWDQTTPITLSDPLKVQERSRGKSLKLPKIIPLVWQPCDDEFEPHLQRHIHNAEQWIKAVSHTSFQGEARHVPITMIAPTEGRLLGRRHLLEWQDYLKTEAEVPVSVVGKNEYEKGVACSCQVCTEECVCPCASCERQRACDCTEVCHCPAVCDCRCDHCHKPESAPLEADRTVQREANGNRKRIVENYTHLDRKCITDGCDNLAPANSQSGLYCKPCWKKKNSADRECWTLGCNNKAPFGGSTGKACLDCSRTNPDKVCKCVVSFCKIY
jgi:hypothetical protein